MNCIKTRTDQRSIDSTCKLDTHIGRLAVVICVENVARQTEVGDFNDKVFGDENVSGCQVAVNALLKHESSNAHSQSAT